MNLDRYRVFLLDMDGTVYLGDRIFADTPAFLSRLRETGRQIVFLTNNSSRSSAAYLRKLRKMGIKAQQEEVYTSGDATIRILLEEKPGASVFLLGTPSLKRSFIRAGLRLWSEDVAKLPDYLVIGFDTTVSYRKLATACRLAAAGVSYIATHPDFNCPVPGGFIPDAGAIAAFIEASTGKKPRVIGKPQSGIIDTLVSSRGWSKAEMVMVGDRLYTDIALGMNAGIASILVFSGETGRSEYQEQDTYRATLAVDGIGDLVSYL